jgi:hypothetical protein
MEVGMSILRNAVQNGVAVGEDKKAKKPTPDRSASTTSSETPKRWRLLKRR